jgi:hypothetical protein
MAAELYYAAQAELKPGEQLLWTGYCRSRLGKQEKSGGPAGGLISGAFFGLFGGLLFSAASGLWPPVLLLLTVPLGAFLGYRYSPQTSAYRKSRTIYALTDRRVFVLRDLYHDRQVKNLPLQFITGIELDGREPTQPKPAGAIPSTYRGTITFFAANLSQRCAKDPYLRFFMTGDAQRAAAMVRQAREKLVDGNA